VSKSQTVVTAGSAELIATEFEKADVSGDAYERGETANCGH